MKDDITAQLIETTHTYWKKMMDDTFTLQRYGRMPRASTDTSAVKVRIEKAGRVHVATVEVGGVKVTASAIREEGDPDHDIIGAELALGRALRDLGRGLVKGARQMDRKISGVRRA